MLSKSFCHLKSFVEEHNCVHISKLEDCDIHLDQSGDYSNMEKAHGPFEL